MHGCVTVAARLIASLSASRLVWGEQVGRVASRVLMASPLTREMLERECEREHGATPEQVEMALHREDSDK